MSKKKYQTCRIILGDQLSHQISSLQGIDKKNDIVLMMEVYEEVQLVKHHPIKLVFFFSAMRHFADELSKKHIDVHYHKIDDTNKQSSFTSILKEFLHQHEVETIVITFPGEYRVLSMIKTWEKEFGVEVDVRDDDRFFSSPAEFATWAKNRKEYRMEYFYRHLRQQHQILMDDTDPIGGAWNFDKDNRKSLPRDIQLPAMKTVKPDSITSEVMQTVNRFQREYYDDVETFPYAVTHAQARTALRDFIENRLPYFGDYQDAMKAGEHVLFHSVISQYLNIGLLLPEEACTLAEQAFHDGHAPINAVEGFIRQILGWREFIRGVYWHEMPKYSETNYFRAAHDLPEFYWTAKTPMNCMKHVINQTLETSQSHHIQRLMVTGNFALLYGIEPKQICEWYLAVYLDAIEWVELPNTHGMAIYADGGKFASKPYAASGKYINKMSDFCKDCEYNVKERATEDACPFNTFYWEFLIRHYKTLQQNSRMKLMLSHVDKLSEADKRKIKQRARLLRDEFDTN